MKIGLDASWAGVAGTGTARYTRHLIQALLQAFPAERYVLYFGPGDQERNPLWPLSAAFERQIVAGRGQLGRTLWSLSRAIHHDNLDVFHSPGYFLPWWGGPSVVTFHDANAVLQWQQRMHPRRAGGTISLAAQSFLSARRATAIIADSHAAANDIRRVFRIPAPRLHVIYPGVHLPPAGSTTAGHGRYLLYVGELTEHKNVHLLPEVLRLLACPDLRLLVAGRDAGGYVDRMVRPAMERAGVGRQVHLLSVVLDDQLAALYAGAAAFVFPSLGEGFGLPPLEAMLAGIPVVATEAGSLPEVLSEAALLVPPGSAPALANALRRVLTDTSLASDLAARGQEQAARYSWERAAHQTMDLYRAVAR